MYSSLSEKRYKSCHWGGTFSKGTLLYLKGAYWYLNGTNGQYSSPWSSRRCPSLI